VCLDLDVIHIHGIQIEINFDAKTVPCIFVGYSNQHKGYRCLDLKTYRMFLLRYVVFDENHFPCRKKENSPSSHTSSTKSFGIFLFLPTMINTVPPVDAPLCNPLHESSPPPVPVVEDVPSDSPSNHDHTLAP